MNSFPSHFLVSIIMPIRNEGAFIARSLGAVLTQDYPHEKLEVLIADGMSADNTREEISRCSANATDVQVKVIDNPHGIVPTGFNLALAQATGEIIIRVDGHTVIERDYVRKCVAVLSSSGADNVGGRMNAVGATPFAEAVAVGTSSPFGVGGGRFHNATKEEWVDTVYMGAWRRDVFSRVGLFDEEMVRNQDDEFNYRMRSRGCRILLSPKIRSTYYNRTNAKALFRQYYQYGYWKVRVLQKHPAQMRWTQFVPAALMLALVVTAVTSLVSREAAYLPGVLLLTYLVAGIVTAVLKTREIPVPIAARLPLVFALLHFGYGTGFIHGMISFASKWRKTESIHSPILQT